MSTPLSGSQFSLGQSSQSANDKNTRLQSYQLTHKKCTVLLCMNIFLLHTIELEL